MYWRNLRECNYGKWLLQHLFYASVCSTSAELCRLIVNYRFVATVHPYLKFHSVPLIALSRTGGLSTRSMDSSDEAYSAMTDVSFLRPSSIAFVAVINYNVYVELSASYLGSKFAPLQWRPAGTRCWGWPRPRRMTGRCFGIRNVFVFYQLFLYERF